MLQIIGVETLEDLIDQTVPRHIRLSDEEVQMQRNILNGPLSEYTALNLMKEIASKNKIFRSYIGNGFNPTIVPSVISRNLLENPGWYTSYTPYQAEISQGRLESLLNYQTLISEITGLPIANASLLDEATAAAEAMFISFSHHKEKKTDYFIDSDIFPFIKDTIRTRAYFLGINVMAFYLGH